MEKFFSLSNNELQCVTDKINIDAPFFKEKFRIIEQQILTCFKNKSTPTYINSQNYKQYLNDLEIESFFDEIFRYNNSLFPYEYKFLFLLAISEQGYNFGQYRIMSHLIKLGYSQEDIIIFPLYIKGNSYVYDKDHLKEILQKYSKNLFICETAYIGWENQTKEINSFIKSICNHSILTGGPLTSSHFNFCLNNLNTDIVLTGHGEYVIEAFLKELAQKRSLSEINIDDIFFVNYPIKTKITSRTNKYIDFLYWDIELLARLYELVPIINLFTSEECKGNCIFCYRNSYHNQNSMDNNELLNRIRKITTHPKFNKFDKVYIRFFDDDFFAPPKRNFSFLKNLLHILGERFVIAEFTFSIRSIYNLYLLEGEKVFDILQKFHLKRVTIGVDGFNDNDLKYLQKGYHFNKVLFIAEKFNYYKIPTLMYAILTTHETNYIDLFHSLINMLNLILKGNIYIGPTITPCIYVQNANQKLYPKFSGNKTHYLDVQSFHKATSNIIVDIYDIIMSAKILPKDNIVYNIINKINFPTLKESAYILPLICTYMKVCAEECNKLSNSLFKKTMYSKKNLLVEKIKEIESNEFSSDNTEAQIDFINTYFNLKRELDITNYYLGLNDDDIQKKIQKIFSLVDEYYKLYKDQSSFEIDYYNSQLCNNVRRLLILPLKVFYSELQNNLDRLCLLNTINNIPCQIHEKEYELFKNYI